MDIIVIIVMSFLVGYIIGRIHGREVEREEEVKEEDGKVVLNHRPKKRKSRNRLKKLAKAYQR